MSNGVMFFFAHMQRSINACRCNNRPAVKKTYASGHVNSDTGHLVRNPCVILVCMVWPHVLIGLFTHTLAFSKKISQSMDIHHNLLLHEHPWSLALHWSLCSSGKDSRVHHTQDQGMQGSSYIRRINKWLNSVCGNLGFNILCCGIKSVNIKASTNVSH